MAAVARVYIETYGCALSEFDSALMAETLRARGHSLVKDPSEADVLLVNTCAVRLDTEQRIAKRLAKLRRLYPGARLVVAGCLAKSRPGLIARVAPGASLVSPQNVVNVWKAVESTGRVVLLEGSRPTNVIPRIPVSMGVATMMIQEGCLSDCSFCITKIARREVKSYPPRAIVEAVRDAVERGAVEIRLTGQDTGVYGVDLPGKPRLPDLIAAILDKVPGDYRIRVGMMNPEHLLEWVDDYLDLFKDERLYRFFHIPVQTGDDELLKLMRRNYTVAEFKSIVKRIRERVEDPLIATDIIVGHPGETEESFKKTLDLVKELRFERVHMAQYTIRPRTLAAGLPQVPDPVKKARSTALAKLVERIGLERYSRYIGSRLRALVAGAPFREESLVARIQNYTPVVIPEGEARVGEWVEVEITGATFFDLRGRAVRALARIPAG